MNYFRCQTNLTSCRTVDGIFEQVRSWRLVLLELLDGHVVGLWNEAALGNLSHHRTTEPVRDEVRIDVVD